MTVRPGRHLKAIKHGVTRFRITLDCYEAEYVAHTKRKPNAEKTRWLGPEELDAYPLNSTGRQLSRLAGG